MKLHRKFTAFSFGHVIVSYQSWGSTTVHGNLIIDKDLISLIVFQFGDEIR